MRSRPTRRARKGTALQSLFAENIGDLSVGFFLVDDACKE
jgi:hypothetical protein